MNTLTLSRVTRALLSTGHGYRLANWLIDRHLRTSRPEVVAKVLGVTMRLDPSEFVDKELLFYPSQYEAAEISFMGQVLREGGIFVDVGAHIGFHSLLAAKMVGSAGLIISIEADPDTYERLLGNINLNQTCRMKTFNRGVADNDGVMTLHRYIGNLASNSFIVGTQPNFARSGAVEVKCTTLLKLLLEAAVPRVDFLKMDIEAFEYRVLKRFLAESPGELLPRLILLEYHPQYESEAGGSPLPLLEADGRYRELRISGMIPRNHAFARRLE